MAALSYLRGAGLIVEAVAGRLRVSPVERITPELRQYIATHKAELLAALEVANDHQAGTWLHLLALADGRVIQRCGESSTAQVEQAARQQYGDDLLVVKPVQGYQRPLTEPEIVKALAGTLSPPPAMRQPSSAWLVRVARMLGIQPAELLEGGYLDQHDLAELAGTDPEQVADTIRSSPAWINRPQRVEPPVVESAAEKDAQPQRTIRTAATASPEWLAARDQFVGHVMACRACYAPLSRYCEAGAELHQKYITATP